MYKLFQMNGSRKSSLGTFAGVEEAKDAATQRVEGTIEWRDDLRATVDGDLFFGLMIKEEDKPGPPIGEAEMGRLETCPSPSTPRPWRIGKLA